MEITAKCLACQFSFTEVILFIHNFHMSLFKSSLIRTVYDAVYC